jgi:hypothetical protein
MILAGIDRNFPGHRVVMDVVSMVCKVLMVANPAIGGLS